VHVGWNSAHVILKELIPYEVTFSDFINAITIPRKPLPTPANWNGVEVLTSVLEMFYDAIVSLAGGLLLLSYISFNGASYFTNFYSAESIRKGSHSTRCC
jgi:hypothetical protein